VRAPTRSPQTGARSRRIRECSAGCRPQHDVHARCWSPGRRCRTAGRPGPAPLGKRGPPWAAPSLWFLRSAPASPRPSSPAAAPHPSQAHSFARPRSARTGTRSLPRSHRAAFQRRRRPARPPGGATRNERGSPPQSVAPNPASRSHSVSVEQRSCTASSRSTSPVPSYSVNRWRFRYVSPARRSSSVVSRSVVRSDTCPSRTVSGVWGWPPHRPRQTRRPRKQQTGPAERSAPLHHLGNPCGHVEDRIRRRNEKGSEDRARQCLSRGAPSRSTPRVRRAFPQRAEQFRECDDENDQWSVPERISGRAC